MNTNPLRTFLAVAGLAAMPAFAAAGDERIAVDSCVRALVASIAARTTTPVKLRAYHFSDPGMSIASGAGSHYEFTVVARRAQDHMPLARAVCRTDDHDQVVELESQPLSGLDF